MTTSEQQVIHTVAQEVRGRLADEGSGHDWWHIRRVWKMAERLAKAEKADFFTCSLAALLHDIADWKFYGGDDTVGPRVARQLLVAYEVAEPIQIHVADIIATMSFKGAGVESTMKTLEGQVVQDADRLDALGAIGVARAFAYGGHANRLLHDPERKPTMHTTKEAYFNDKGTTVNHFYEKLLLLKDRINTKTAKQIAEARHQYMELYLQQFLDEWEQKV